MKTSKKSNFIQSNLIGQIAETKVCELISHLGNIEKNKCNKFDIKVIGPIDFSLEVKYDNMANITNNIAVEFFNTKLAKPSGIETSHANFWVFYLNDSEIYFVTLKELKQYVAQNKPYKTFTNAGDGNAAIHLYKKSDITSIFTNLAEANSDTIRQYIVQSLN